MRKQEINAKKVALALQKKEFYLLYQPLIDLRTNRVVGVEALTRWHNPSLGEISPVDFITAAEKTDLIIALGNWVLEEACKQLMRWHEQGFYDLYVAVNISAQQFNEKGLPERVLDVLNKSGLDARFLELELTESLLVKNIKQAVAIMNRLKAIGVRLVIDDFGTGYANFAYLREFPVDKIKLDRSFMLGLANKQNTAAIVQAIINLGHKLRLQVLAEGIETDLQKELITAYGCDYAQGYYFKTPSAVEELNEFLERFARFKYHDPSPPTHRPL